MPPRIGVAGRAACCVCVKLGTVAWQSARDDPGQSVHLALAEARKDAASQVADNEEIVSESIRLDGSGSPRLDDASVMEFHYIYTVMVPGCSGWSRPLT